MKEYFRKAISIFHSPGILAVIRWSECVHRKVLLICLFTAISSLCSLGFTLATKGLVDSAVSSQMHQLQRFSLLLGIIILARVCLATIQGRLEIQTSSELQKQLQGMLTKQLLSKEYSRIKGFHSGELVNRVFSDVSVVKKGIVQILPDIIYIVISFFGAAIILIQMDWHFVILLIGGSLLGTGLLILFRAPMKNRHKTMQEAEGALHAAIQETLENIRLIKASVSENRAFRHIYANQENLCQQQIHQGNFKLILNQVMGLIFDLSWLFCMIWGCLNIFRGQMTYGSLAAILQLISRIQGPIASAVSITAEVYGVTSSAERMLELTGLPDEEPGESLSSFDRICLNQVTFLYDDGIEPVLQHISHTIYSGDFLALTGISGGGKTSLFQLLLGIYRPTSGSIVFCCGSKSVPASRSTRNLFAYVPQGNTLFSGTLRENLTMFTDHASEEDIRKAVKAACIEEMVEEMGLDAVLGERGIGLSEGQAQRVAVARALLSNAPILLLDEATSALDELTEALLLKNLSTMRDKTCIIVTHRRAALEICDYILHISEGKMEQKTVHNIQI